MPPRLRDLKRLLEVISGIVAAVRLPEVLGVSLSSGKDHLIQWRSYSRLFQRSAVADRTRASSEYQLDADDDGAEKNLVLYDIFHARSPAAPPQRSRCMDRCMRALRLVLAAASLFCQSLGAQITTDTIPAPEGAPVAYGVDTLFTLYGRLGPFGPRERAAAIEQRLSVLGPRLGTRVDSIVVNTEEVRSELLVGDAILMTVLDDDAAPTGQRREALAQKYAERIQQATISAVQAATPTKLLIDGAKALATTIGLLLLLFLLKLGFHRLYGFLSGPKMPPLRIKRLELLSAARLGESFTALARFIRVIVTLLLLYIYVPLVLSFFPWTAPYSPRIVGYVVTPLRAMGAGLLHYLPNLFLLGLIVLATRYLLKLIHVVFQAIRSGGLVFRNFKPEWAPSTYNIVRFLVIAFALVVMWPYLPGSDTEAFKGVSLFLGVLFSLGSSGAVGNIVSGVVLTYTDAFKIGDRVKIGETTGDVIERTMLVTRVRTIKNVDIAIPNSAVLSNQVINYSSQATKTGLILHTTVTIGYEVPWRQVHELLIAAARETANIHADPTPFVLQTSLDDFYVSYELNAYTDQPAVMAGTYSELHQRIQDQFNQHGVEILSPHYRALRDGNMVGIPVENLSATYAAPSFRIEQVRPGAPDI